MSAQKSLHEYSVAEIVAWSELDWEKHDQECEHSESDPDLPTGDGCIYFDDCQLNYNSDQCPGCGARLRNSPDVDGEDY